MSLHHLTLGELLAHHLSTVRRHAIGILKALLAEPPEVPTICNDCRKVFKDCICTP